MAVTLESANQKTDLRKENTASLMLFKVKSKLEVPLSRIIKLENEDMNKFLLGLQDEMELYFNDIVCINDIAYAMWNRRMWRWKTNLKICWIHFVSFK